MRLCFLITTLAVAAAARGVAMAAEDTSKPAAAAKAADAAKPTDEQKPAAAAKAADATKPAGGQSVAEAEAELLALERETYAALQTRDPARFGKLLADDFVYRSPGQPDADKAAFLKSVAELPGTILKIDGEDVKVVVRGEAALITGVQRVQLQLPDGTVQAGATAFSDFCVRRAGRWVLAAAFGVEVPPK